MIRERAFWAAQVLGWLALAALKGGVVATAGSTWTWMVMWALSGLAMSTLAGLVYQRFLLKDSVDLVLVVSIVVVSTVAATLQGLLLTVASMVHGGWSPNWVGAPTLALAPQLRATIVFITWSGIFVGAVLSRRLAAERERRLQALATAQAAQLQVLRSQLQPHFLFNALNSIVALIGLDPPRAQTVVRILAKLLRSSLERSDEHGSVAQELELVTLYVAIERVRFEKRLNVEFNVDTAARSAPMLPMSLYTLVENACKHGAAHNNALDIHIHIQRDGNRIHVRVSNTGTLRDAEPGVGLTNLRERLQCYYPGRHTLTLAQSGHDVVAELRYTVSPS